MECALTSCSPTLSLIICTYLSSQLRPLFTANPRKKQTNKQTNKNRAASVYSQTGNKYEKHLKNVRWFHTSSQRKTPFLIFKTAATAFRFFDNVLPPCMSSCLRVYALFILSTSLCSIHRVYESMLYSFCLRVSTPSGSYSHVR